MKTFLLIFYFVTSDHYQLGHLVVIFLSNTIRLEEISAAKATQIMFSGIAGNVHVIFVRIVYMSIIQSDEKIGYDNSNYCLQRTRQPK